MEYRRAGRRPLTITIGRARLDIGVVPLLSGSRWYHRGKTLGAWADILRVAGEEEQAVLQDRSSHAAAKIVQDKMAFPLMADTACPGIGVYRRILEILKDAAVILIRAAIGDKEGLRRASPTTLAGIELAALD